MSLKARLRPAAAVLVTVAAGGLGVLSSSPASAAPCPGSTGVTVVVESNRLGAGSSQSCVTDGSGHTADRLLKDAGHSLTYVQRFPGFVCQIDGLPADDPCVNTPPADAYWGLWWSDGKTGKWTYSSLGAGSLSIPAGGYVAMVWDGSSGDVRPSAVPAAAPGTHAIAHAIANQEAVADAHLDTEPHAHLLTERRDLGRGHGHPDGEAEPHQDPEAVANAVPDRGDHDGSTALGVTVGPAVRGGRAARAPGRLRRRRRRRPARLDATRAGRRAARRGRRGRRDPAPDMISRLPRDLHPIAWWGWALGLAVAASSTTNPWVLLLYVGVAALVVAARRGEHPWSGSFRLYVILAVVIVAVRVVFRVIFGGGDFGTVLVDLPEVPLPGWALGVHLLGPLTQESLLAALYDGMRLGTIVICVGAANSLANPKRLLRSMPSALYEIGTAMVVAVTVLPQLADSVWRVRAAQRLRGGEAGRVRRLRRLLVPVLEDAFERSLALAAGMDTRGYGRTTGLTPGRRRLTGALMLTGCAACASAPTPSSTRPHPASWPCPCWVSGCWRRCLGCWVPGDGCGPAATGPTRGWRPSGSCSRPGSRPRPSAVLTAHRDVALAYPASDHLAAARRGASGCSRSRARGRPARRRLRPSTRSRRAADVVPVGAS